MPGGTWVLQGPAGHRNLALPVGPHVRARHAMRELGPTWGWRVLAWSPFRHGAAAGRHGPAAGHPPVPAGGHALRRAAPKWPAVRRAQAAQAPASTAGRAHSAGYAQARPRRGGALHVARASRSQLHNRPTSSSSPRAARQSDASAHNSSDGAGCHWKRASMAPRIGSGAWMRSMRFPSAVGTTMAVSGPALVLLISLAAAGGLGAALAAKARAALAPGQGRAARPREPTWSHPTPLSETMTARGATVRARAQDGARQGCDAFRRPLR